jgi:hypothetical protein
MEKVWALCEQLSPHLFKADYVEVLMRKRALEGLRSSQGSGLTVVDTAAAAVFMTRAYSEKEMQKLLAPLRSIEEEYVITTRWSDGSEEYKSALEELRNETLLRYVVMFALHVQGLGSGFVSCAA